MKEDESECGCRDLGDYVGILPDNCRYPALLAAANAVLNQGWEAGPDFGPDHWIVDLSTRDALRAAVSPALLPPREEEKP